MNNVCMYKILPYLPVREWPSIVRTCKQWGKSNRIQCLFFATRFHLSETPIASLFNRLDHCALILGPRIVCAADKSIEIRNEKTVVSRLQFRKKIAMLAVSRTGLVAVASFAHDIFVKSVQGTYKKTILHDTLSDYAQKHVIFSLESLAFLPDDRLLSAYYTPSAGHIVIWNLEQPNMREKVFVLPEFRLEACVLSPSGTTFLAQGIAKNDESPPVLGSPKHVVLNPACGGGQSAASPCIDDPHGVVCFGCLPAAAPCISPTCAAHSSSTTCLGLPSFEREQPSTTPKPNPLTIVFYHYNFLSKQLKSIVPLHTVKRHRFALVSNEQFMAVVEKPDNKQQLLQMNVNDTTTALLDPLEDGSAITNLCLGTHGLFYATTQDRLRIYDLAHSKLLCRYQFHPLPNNTTRTLLLSSVPGAFAVATAQNGHINLFTFKPVVPLTATTSSSSTSTATTSTAATTTTLDLHLTPSQPSQPSVPLASPKKHHPLNLSPKTPFHGEKRPLPAADSTDPTKKQRTAK